MGFPELNIGNIVSKIPIIQGGMGVGISLSRLASAVANEGGIGVIAAAMPGIAEPDIATNSIKANIRALKREITKAKKDDQRRSWGQYHGGVDEFQRHGQNVHRRGR